MVKPTPKAIIARTARTISKSILTPPSARKREGCLRVWLKTANPLLRLRRIGSASDEQRRGVLAGRACAGPRLPPAALLRAARGRRARRPAACDARVDGARTLALLSARVALAGRRGRRLCRAPPARLEHRGDTARFLARLASRAAMGLLDPERGGLARRPGQGARRGGPACVGCVGGCG